MKGIFGLLVGVCMMIAAGSILWSLRTKVALPPATGMEAAKQQVKTDLESAQEAKTHDMITLTGPLANYVAHQEPPQADIADTEDAHPARPFNPADRVGDSPVGTSTPILHKTFAVAKAVDLPFEIAAHAATPQLRGTYRSFLQRGAVKSGDGADVEFLLMNAQQYEDLLDGHPADAQFSTESAHSQEVNTNIPPTFDHPVTYYLVFRNDSKSPGKVMVDADFRVDY